MMMKSRGGYIAALIALCVLFTVEFSPLRAQYYTWGSDVPSLKWRDIKTPDVRLIYPDTVDGVARRVLLYLDSVRGTIDFGFEYPPLYIPFIMHPENFASNGLVMWMPKRIEFLTSPNIESFSMPWTKQLVAHEYRHAVQYNNLNKGVVKVMSYILGEQGSSMGLLFLPLSIIEGDAVKCETSMSTYGRGLQPSFTMGYRAIGREDMMRRRNIDRWFSGSYREFTPDHYRLGFQIVDYTYTRFGENIWNKVAEFGVRRPYYVATVSTALKKYYGTDNAKLVRATFNDLFDYWESLPARENTTQIVMPIDSTNYTTYSHPIPYGEGRVVALKSDYSYPSRFVMVDDDGEREERLAYTGSVSTRPTLGADRLWWSEYRYSKLFSQRVNSQLCYMDLERGKPQTLKGFTKTLYPTVIDDSTNHIAYVEYDPSGLYSIVEVRAVGDRPRNRKDVEQLSRTAIKFPTEVHGLAWDDKTEQLYFIATDDSGMWLGVVDRDSKGGFRQLREGAYISLSNLRAEGGRLYYGSIESGYDELHCYDIESGREYRLSTSKYGSFDPSTPVDGNIYATTYDRYGYHLARQSVREGVEVRPTKTPQNIVNPERTKWDMINLDTVHYSALDSIASHKNHKSKSYNKGLKLFNVHSWMPMAFNPFEFSSEQLINMTAGATVMSQNLLSSTEAYASYGYNSTEGSLISGGINYTGLGVDLEFGATYGGNQIVYTNYGNYATSQQEYYSLTTSATLPLYYQRGYHNRLFSIYSSWNFSNGQVQELEKIEFDENTGVSNYRLVGYSEGLHKMVFGVSYADVVRSATRDAVTPWGYSISAYYALSPNEREFSDLLSVYGKIYTRGFLPYNSFTVAASYQTSVGDNSDNSSNKMFSSVSLLPRGFSSVDVDNKNYASTSVNYQFPLCYPEGGIGSIIYFRRMRLNLGFDAARFDNFDGGSESIYSYGGDLILDINPLRMPEASTTAIKFSLYQPSEGTLSFTMGVELPF